MEKNSETRDNSFLFLREAEQRKRANSFVKEGKREDLNTSDSSFTQDVVYIVDRPFNLPNLSL